MSPSDKARAEKRRPGGPFRIVPAYIGGKCPVCLDADDANDDGEMSLTDAIRILSFLYLEGARARRRGHESYARFALSTSHPPSPIRALDNSLNPPAGPFRGTPPGRTPSLPLLLHHSRGKDPAALDRTGTNGSRDRPGR